MINLSELARESGFYSGLKALRSLRDPDIYLAESVTDFQKHAPQIVLPWYRKDFLPRAFVILHNVRLTKIESPFYVMQDRTGGEVTIWKPFRNLFDPRSTQEIVQEHLELEDEFVYEVFLRYFIHYNLPEIVEVSRTHGDKKQPETEKLLDRVKQFLPRIEPIPELVPI